MVNEPSDDQYWRAVFTAASQPTAIASTSTVLRADYLRGGQNQGSIIHLRPLQLGPINLTAAVTLDSKADFELAISPNPLVRMASIRIMAGDGTGPWNWDCKLVPGWVYSQPWAQPKSMVPPP